MCFALHNYTDPKLGGFLFVYGWLVVMLAGGFWFGLGSFRVGNIETAEEISKERGASDTESLAVRVKFSPKPVKAQQSLLSLCIGLRQR